MDVDVNYWAVLLAALSSMAVGSTWYARSTFGRTWAKLANVKIDRKVQPAEMGRLLGVAFLASLVTAYVLAHFVYVTYQYFGGDWLMRALTTAFWAWLGFTAARVLTHDLFENRPTKLTLLTWGNELVTILVMALVIGLIRP